MNKRETELEQARADGWRRLHDGTPHTPLCSSCADIEQARQRVAALSAQRPAALLCELRAAEDRLRELRAKK